MTTDSRPRVVAAVPSGPSPVPRGGPAGPAPAGPAGTGPGRCPQPSSTWRSRPRAVADLARAFAELFCEVEAGLRPRAHLEAVMTPLLAARLAPVWVRRGPTAQVVTTTGELVSPTRYAAVAVLRRGGRWGALALELERRRGSWTVVEAARPEDGVLPTPAWAPPLAEPDAFDLVCGALAG
ncbi:MAG TPA: Rv3235 family protein [Egibacteraceae bacterium]